MAHPDSRRRGRAIRKERRETAEMVATLGQFGKIAGIAAAQISVFMASMSHFADVTMPTVAELKSMRKIGSFS